MVALLELAAVLLDNHRVFSLVTIQAKFIDSSRFLILPLIKLLLLRQARQVMLTLPELLVLARGSRSLPQIVENVLLLDELIDLFGLRSRSLPRRRQHRSKPVPDAQRLQGLAKDLLASR